VNATWETILDQFLSGEGSRADVESLRLRLSLGADEREEVEATLRLVDELHAVGETIAVPQGALERLSVSLREHIAQDASDSPAPRWEWDGATYRADPMVLRPTSSVDDEGIANSIIEGNASPAGYSLTAASSNSQLDEFQRIIDTLSDPSARPPLPQGAEDRLVAKLRGHMQSPAEQVDPNVARRILRQLESCPLPSLFSENVPDVLAATTDSDPESTSPEAPKDKPQ
jgi:hypothetical protein